MMELELALPGDRFLPWRFEEGLLKGSTLPTAYATIYGSRLVFVQDHLAVFHPERPGIAGDLLVNALAQFVVEWGLVQSRQLTLKLHAEHRCDSLAGGRGGAGTAAHIYFLKFSCRL